MSNVPLPTLAPAPMALTAFAAGSLHVAGQELNCSGDVPTRSLDLSTSSISFGRDDAHVHFVPPTGSGTASVSPPSAIARVETDTGGEASSQSQNQPTGVVRALSFGGREPPLGRLGVMSCLGTGATRAQDSVSQQVISASTASPTAVRSASVPASSAPLVSTSGPSPRFGAVATASSFAATVAASPGQTLDWDTSLSREISLGSGGCCCGGCGGLQKLSPLETSSSSSDAATAGTYLSNASGSRATVAPGGGKSAASLVRTPGSASEAATASRSAKQSSSRSRLSCSSSDHGGGDVLLQLRLCSCGKGLALQGLCMGGGSSRSNSTGTITRHRNHKVRASDTKLGRVSVGPAALPHCSQGLAPPSHVVADSAVVDRCGRRRRPSSMSAVPPKPLASASLAKEAAGASVARVLQHPRRRPSRHRRRCANSAATAASALTWPSTRQVPTRTGSCSGSVWDNSAEPVTLGKLQDTVGALRERYLEKFVLQRTAA